MGALLVLSRPQVQFGLTGMNSLGLFIALVAPSTFVVLGLLRPVEPRRGAMYVGVLYLLILVLASDAVFLDLLLTAMIGGGAAAATYIACRKAATSAAGEKG